MDADRRLARVETIVYISERERDELVEGKTGGRTNERRSPLLRTTFAINFGFTLNETCRSLNSSVESQRRRSQRLNRKVNTTVVAAARHVLCSTRFLDRSLLKSKAEQFSQKNSSTSNDESPPKKWKKETADQFSRVDLVLNVEQLLVGNYPCPTYNPFRDFKQLRSSYEPVTPSSRIFALDVETVRSTALFGADDARE
jgi:hypothetical protein